MEGLNMLLGLDASPFEHGLETAGGKADSFLKNKGQIKATLSLDMSAFQRALNGAESLVAKKVRDFNIDISRLNFMNRAESADLTEDAQKKWQQDHEKHELVWRLTDSEQETYDRHLRAVENAQRRVLMNNRDADIARYSLEHSNKFDRKMYEIKKMRDYQLDVLDSKYVKLQEELKKAYIPQIEEAIKARLEAIEAEQIAVDEKYSARIALIAEAEELAERQKTDFIRNIEQELSAEIQAVNQNSLERKLSQIEKEKQAWIKRGAEVAQAEQLAQAKRLQAYQETEKKLNEIRNSVASTERSEIEKRIADIEREKEAWIQAGMEKAEAEELAQQKIQKAVEENETARQEAAENYAQSVAKAYDDAARKTQASFDEAERKNAALRNEAFSVLKQEAKEFEVFMKEGYEGLRKLLYNKMIKSGVNPDQLKQMTPETLSAYQNATKRAMKSFLPNWEDPYSGKVYAPKMPEIPDILKEVPKTISAFSSATDAATKALYNFAGVADNSTVRQPMGEIDSSLMPSFEGLPTAVQNAVEVLNNLPMAVMGVQENFGQMSTPQMEQIINPFSSMDQDLQVTIQRFSEMNLGVEEVTVRLNDLSAALNNISLRNGNSSARETRPPIIVNATVQIEEAHAWDSQHIQELAERVADKLESPIINAIGGDDNAY